MKWLFYLFVLAIGTAFFGWCEWLASSHRRRAGAREYFRIVLPFRLLAALLFLFAARLEWGKDMGIIFLVMAIGSVPPAAYLWTLTITLDADTVSMQHIFGNRRLRFAEIVECRFRTRWQDYVIRGRDGRKIVFPDLLQAADYVFGRCARQKPSQHETD